MGYLDPYFFVKRANVDRLLALPNVHGVGIGRKVTGGTESDEIVIGVAVTSKVSASGLAEADRVPEWLEGEHRGQTVRVRTDVFEMPEFVIAPVEAASAERPVQKPMRPAQPGASMCGATLGDKDGGLGLGTFGCGIVWNKKGYLLSCLHVLQDNVFKPVQVPVLQPSRGDGGQPDHAIADATHGSTIDPNKVNILDAGLALVRDTKLINPYVISIGRMKGHYKQLVLGWHLRKYGRTTQLTDAHIKWHDYTATTKNGPLNKPVLTRFDHQVLLYNYAGVQAGTQGDSGAVWVTDDQYAAAILLAENIEGVVATPIQFLMGGISGATIWIGAGRNDELEEGEAIDPDDPPFSDAVMAIIFEDIGDNPMRELPAPQ